MEIKEYLINLQNENVSQDELYSLLEELRSDAKTESEEDRILKNNGFSMRMVFMGFTNLSAKMIELKIWRLWFAKITQEYLAVCSKLAY